MKYKHKASQEEKQLEDIKTEFHRLRASDDEFARDYARHEFDIYLNQRYVKVEDIERPKSFKKYLNEYNQLREKMMFHIAHNDLYSHKGLRTLTADELLGIIQESEK